MSLGRSRLLRTNSSSPGGRSFLVLPVSMLCSDIHTLSTFCTGLHPCWPRRSRQMMPFEYMWGCIGIGRSGFWTKVTSGGSDPTISPDFLTNRTRPFARFFTDWVLVPKPEHQPVDIWVERVVVEDFDVQVPDLEIVGRHKRDASWEVASDLSWQLSQLARTEARGSSVVAGVTVLPGDGSWRGLWRSLGRACVRGQAHRDDIHTFVNSFPSRLCAKLAPMVCVKEEEEKVVGAGGVRMAPSRGRRPRLHTSGAGYWR